MPRAQVTLRKPGVALLARFSPSVFLVTPCRSDLILLLVFSLLKRRLARRLAKTPPDLQGVARVSPYLKRALPDALPDALL
jgi:hypothetical protein